MKNLFPTFRIWLGKSYNILKGRFGIQTVIIIFLTCVFLYLVNSEDDSQIVLSLIFTSIATLFLSLGIKLFYEVSGKNYYYILNIIPFIYGVIFFFTIESSTDIGIEGISYFLLHLAGFISFIFFAPYLPEVFRGKVEKTEYTNYFTRIAWSLLMSFIVGISVMLLGFIAITSVIELFDLGVLDDDKLYANWATLSLSLFAPLYLLAQLPVRNTISKVTFEINRFFSFLIRFVATPFIYIYFFILYAYTVKVLINFSDWPNGIISWLVIGFSAFGYITYIFSHAYEDSSDTVKIFRRYFPIIVIPQLGMLFYAIGIRIEQYDLTMNRYFVVVFGIWLLLISTYLILSKRKSLVVIPATLTLIALLISFGPWSVYSFPVSRQYNRIVTTLHSEGFIAENGAIIRMGSGLSHKDQKMMYSQIEYVCEFDDCKKIIELFPETYKRISPTITGTGILDEDMPSTWEITRAVGIDLGLITKNSYELEKAESNFTNLNIKSPSAKFSIFPLDISGYERIVPVLGKDIDGENYTSLIGYTIINPETEMLTVNLDYGKYNVNIDLSIINNELRLKYNTDTSTLEAKDLTWLITGKDYEIKLILSEYTFKKNKAVETKNRDHYYDIAGYALIRKLK